MSYIFKKMWEEIKKQFSNLKKILSKDNLTFKEVFGIFGYMFIIILSIFLIGYGTVSFIRGD